jgi:DNA-binding transcriptional regulator YiaG
MAKKKTTRPKASEKKQASRQGAYVFDQETRARYEQILLEVSENTQFMEDAIRESQRLSKDDFAIRINARG